jgi:putative transposase
MSENGIEFLSVRFVPRRRRTGAAGLPHHVLNRACRRAALFENHADYRDFVQVLIDARARVDMRILAYSVMPNHWHLILWPDTDLQLSRFMHWLTLTHTKRWHIVRGTTGSARILPTQDYSPNGPYLSPAIGFPH